MRSLMRQFGAVLAWATGAAIFTSSTCPLAAAEVAEVVLAQQYGIGYLPLAIMKRERLVEKYLGQVGLSATTVKWVVLGKPCR